MAGELLLDTGALVSLLDRSQRYHESCAAAYRNWTGAVVTTEAVLTESTHLLGRVSGGAIACLEFVLRGGAVLVPSSLEAVRRARRLMEKYADVPMVYADATLVVLAEDLGVPNVFTIDRKGFSAYRARGVGAFQIHP